MTITRSHDLANSAACVCLGVKPHVAAIVGRLGISGPGRQTLHCTAVVALQVGLLTVAGQLPIATTDLWGTHL